MNIVNISIIYMSFIALFAVEIYNIYNICSEKDIFDGLYSERSRGKWAIIFFSMPMFCSKTKWQEMYSSGYLEIFKRVK